MPPAYPSREQTFLKSISQSKEVPPQKLFEKLEIVGKGAYGAVYKGRHIATSQIVALKIINLDTADDDVADIQKEVSLLQQLMTQGQRDAKDSSLGGAGGGAAGFPSSAYGVPNVIKYYGSWLEGPRVWIVMEFAEGGSVRTLSRAQRLSELQIALTVREVLVALAFLHKNGIIHRDIKAANILITSMPNRVLLCDFGVSALLPSTTSKRTTFIGTPYWMAPEVITTGTSYDTKADIWSFGITILEMANGDPPMYGQPAERALAMITKQRAPRLDGGWSKEMKDFVVGCLNEEPADRLSAEELSKLKWVKQQSKTSLSHLNDLLVKMEEWKAKGNQRMSLAEGVGAPINDDDEDSAGQDDWQFNTARSRLQMDPEEARDLLGLPPFQPPSFPSSQPSSVSAPRSLRQLFQTDSEMSSSSQSISSLNMESQSQAGSSTRPSFDLTSAQDNTGTIRTPQRAFRDRAAGRSQSDDAASASNSTTTQSRTNTFRGGGGTAAKHLAPITIPSHADFETSADMNGPSSSRSAVVVGGGSSQQATPRQHAGPSSLSPVSVKGKAPWDSHALEQEIQEPPPQRPAPRRVDTYDDPEAAARKQPPLTFQFPTKAPSVDALTALPQGAGGTMDDPTRPSPPPPLHRNHSAMPGLGSMSPPRKPSASVPVRPGMLRQASVAVMEGRGGTTPVAGTAGSGSLLGGGGLIDRMTPLLSANGSSGGPPSSISMSRSRSGSRVGGELAPLAISTLAIDLKDVLKPPPSITDAGELLPPSPSTMAGSQRHFAAPSPLSGSTITSAMPSHQTTDAFGGGHRIPFADSPLPPTTSSRAPSLDDTPLAAESSSGQMLVTEQPPSPAFRRLGPQLRPLDLARLTHSDRVFEELGQTAADMSQWLNLVVNGLDDLLAAGDHEMVGVA